MCTWITNRKSNLIGTRIRSTTGSKAFYLGCEKIETGVIPLLASPQGGEAASSRKFREATEADAVGVVFLLYDRKTTPASRSADAPRHFLDRSATPPCGDARRGVRLSERFRLI
jgi:hypothetical protein